MNVVDKNCPMVKGLSQFWVIIGSNQSNGVKNKSEARLYFENWVSPRAPAQGL